MNNGEIMELHAALIGMRGSGKSALAVKYLTKRFIGEYHSELEDTYCRKINVMEQPVMLWLMDTVDANGRDSMRYLAWADLFLVVYDVTSQLSLQYAESLLNQIANHEHKLCGRNHKTMLLGNKTDLERYRQVSESDGEKLAKKFGASFGETSAAEDYARVSTVFHRALGFIITERNSRRSPSPRLYSSDSEIQTPSKGRFSMSLKNVARSSTLRRSKSPNKAIDLQQKLSINKRTGSKLLKLFHN